MIKLSKQAHTHRGYSPPLSKIKKKQREIKEKKTSLIRKIRKHVVQMT